VINLDSIWAQMEQEQQWRTDEIRFFDNQASRMEGISNQDRFRRANILLLYSHYEGFCKFAFNLYINSVNSAGLFLADVNYSLVAASLSTVFKELRNQAAKAVEFRNTLPDDSKLHVFARDKAFLENISQYEGRGVSIQDTVVDTESNLKPAVLRKNLFRLGFRYDGLRPIEGDIHTLIGIRNEIAHGASSRGIPADEYLKFREAAFNVMNEIKRYVMNALQNEEYRR
tara:strand:+ start:6024 stop:6707 length:684 start_codon:yes stop_codon:yes gene_type:complete